MILTNDSRMSFAFACLLFQLFRLFGSAINLTDFPVKIFFFHHRFHSQ